MAFPSDLRNLPSGDPHVWFWTQVCAIVMELTLLEVCGASLDELESDEFETTLLEATDNVAD